MQMISDKWVPNSMYSKANITNNWLAGFIDEDGSFL